MKKILRIILIMVIGISILYYYNRIFIKENNKEYIEKKATALKSLEPKRKIAFCENSFFPLVPTAFWVYDFFYNKDASRVERFRLGINEENDLKKLEIKQEEKLIFDFFYSCKEEGIVLTNLDFLFGLSDYNNYYILNLQNEGIFLPKKFDNKEWSTKLIKIKLKKDYSILKEFLLEEEQINFFDKGEEELELFFGKFWVKKIKLQIEKEKKVYSFDEKLNNYLDLHQENLANFDFNLEKEFRLYLDKNPKANSSDFKKYYCDLFYLENIGLVKAVCEDEARNSYILDLNRVKI